MCFLVTICITQNRNLLFSNTKIAPRWMTTVYLTIVFQLRYASSFIMSKILYDQDSCSVSIFNLLQFYVIAGQKIISSRRKAQKFVYFCILPNICDFVFLQAGWQQSSILRCTLISFFIRNKCYIACSPHCQSNKWPFLIVFTLHLSLYNSFRYAVMSQSFLFYCFTRLCEAPNSSVFDKTF